MSKREPMVPSMLTLYLPTLFTSLIADPANEPLGDLCDEQTHYL